MLQKKEKFSQQIIYNFNVCFFISLLPPALYSLYHPSAHFNNIWLTYLILPLVNGLLTLLITLALYYFFSKRHLTIFFNSAEQSRLAFISFCAGFMSLYINTSLWATSIITLLICAIGYRYLKHFTHNLLQLLQPNHIATFSDLSQFANLFLNLLITYAVINLSADAFHKAFNLPLPFQFGHGLNGLINAVYFSIITLTTVGYGDIFPHTPLARIMVSIECMTGYILLALTIGLIIRGVKDSSER